MMEFGLTLALVVALVYTLWFIGKLFDRQTGSIFQRLMKMYLMMLLSAVITMGILYLWLDI